MFSSRGEWFDHEMDVHRFEWTCHFCAGVTCLSEQDFIQHLQTHKQNRGADETQAILQASRSRSSQFSAADCPLCDDWESKLLTQNRYHTGSGTAYVTLKQFRRHLADHLEQLALFAIPRDDLSDSEETDPSIDDHQSDEDGGEPIPSGPVALPSRTTICHECQHRWQIAVSEVVNNCPSCNSAMIEQLGLSEIGIPILDLDNVPVPDLPVSLAESSSLTSDQPPAIESSISILNGKMEEDENGIMCSVDAKGRLPPGWDSRETPDGRQFYADHNTGTTTWRRPSVAEAADASASPFVAEAADASASPSSPERRPKGKSGFLARIVGRSSVSA
jgi:hypothetical protein